MLSKAKPKKSGKAEKESDVSKLVQLIEELKLVPGKDSLIAVVQYGSRKERIPLDSKDFREYLLVAYHDLYEDCPSTQDIANAVTVVKVHWEGKQKADLSYRINMVEDSILIDLHDEELRYVKVSPDGWEVRSGGDEFFISGANQKPQAIPVESEDGIYRLKKYLNLPEDQMFLFMVTAVSCLNPQIQVPILCFLGERGTGKSAMLEILSELIDPNQVQKQNLDAISDRDFGLSLSEAYFTSFDNVSKISRSKSDHLCQAVTGGVQAFRKLYTDGEQCVFDLNCRVAISSIEDCIKAEDLAERTLYFDAQHISKSKRMDEINFWKSFRQDKPYILGHMVELLSVALEIYPKVKRLLKHRHRIASFDEFGCAVAMALEQQDGMDLFTSLMDQNAHRQLRISNEDITFLQSVNDFMDIDTTPHFESAMMEFYETMDLFIEDCEAGEYADVKLGSYDAFTKRIRRLVPYAEQVGLKIEISRRSKDNVSYVAIDKIA